LHVPEAGDGRARLEQAGSERLALVVTDVPMPGLDRLPLAERLRRDEQSRRIPSISRSVQALRANAQRARMLGAVAYLAKPLDPRGLAAFVARQLGSARARSADPTATVANSGSADPR
jgi:CheY-like chemotaxis protein